MTFIEEHAIREFEEFLIAIIRGNGPLIYSPTRDEARNLFNAITELKRGKS